MRRIAVVGAVVGVTAVVVGLVGCSSGGSDAEPARSSTTTDAAGDREWGSPPSTTTPPDPIPWSAVVEAATAPTGRLERTDDAAFPNGRNRVGGTEGTEQTILFDADRQLVRRTSIETIDEAGTRAATEAVYAESGGYVSGE